MNSHARNGKIARLPKVVREEINRRLQDGATGKSLVAWLNSLPEVQAVVAAQFGGTPVSEQNLSQWRRRGYHDWELQQEALEVFERLYRASCGSADGSRPDITGIAPPIAVKSQSNRSAGAIDLQRELR